MLISQKIRITANSEKHGFVVYHGSDWVVRIIAAAARCPQETAAARPAVQTASADDITELERLKRLVDIGVITPKEYEAKKKAILGL